MAKLILTLDTETGDIDYDYPPEEEHDHSEGSTLPPIIVNGTCQSYLKGTGWLVVDEGPVRVDEDVAQRVVTGWAINVQVGELPEERERKMHISRILKWRTRQQAALKANVDEEGLSTFDVGSRSRMEGAIELADELLHEMGYTEESPA